MFVEGAEAVLGAAVGQHGLPGLLLFAAEAAGVGAPLHVVGLNVAAQVAGVARAEATLGARVHARPLLIKGHDHVILNFAPYG